MPRRYPRNAQSRTDALSGSRHVGQHSIRNRAGLKAEYARRVQTDWGSDVVVAAGSAHACNESDIVTGGKILTLTLTGPDRFQNDDNFAALILGFPATDGLRAALAASQFVLSNHDTIVTLTLPAIAGYTISADASYNVVIPASFFKFRQTSLTVTAAIVVTNGA